MKKITTLLALLALALCLTRCAPAKKLRQADENKETVRLWFEEGWNKGRNEELLTRVFHEDWNDGNPIRADQIEGIEGLRQMVAFYRKSFADTRFNITHLFADAEHVAIRYEVSGTHIGDAFGVPASGRKFTSTGIVLYDMENGKIHRTWQELDLMGIVSQLRD